MPNQLKVFWLKFHEKYRGRRLTDEELNKEFLSPPFYKDEKKWRRDNFKGGKEYSEREIWHADKNDPIIYTGPNLSDSGFTINYQKIRPLEVIEDQYTFVRDLKGYMNLWNRSLARKLGLID